jgi:hypothetical protein
VRNEIDEQAVIGRNDLSGSDAASRFPKYPVGKCLDDPSGEG